MAVGTDCPCPRPFKDVAYCDDCPYAPLYLGPLPHYTRRMLQALDAYWTCCEGMPKGRYPRGRYTAEDWWGRYEKYRALAEGQL